MSFLLSDRSRILLFALALPAFAGSSAHGIKNFYRVDEHVYRGAQPTDEEFQYLAKIGVRTVIDLREADERSRPLSPYERFYSGAPGEIGEGRKEIGEDSGQAGNCRAGIGF